jgi:hypothetical protein
VFFSDHIKRKRRFDVSNQSIIESFADVSCRAKSFEHLGHEKILDRFQYDSEEIKKTNNILPLRRNSVPDIVDLSRSDS